MYQSSGQCVLVALDSALLARLVGRLQQISPVTHVTGRGSILCAASLSRASQALSRP